MTAAAAPADRLLVSPARQSWAAARLWKHKVQPAVRERECAVCSRGQRVVYTTPLKALSNQKLHEMRTWFGEARVGLQTGDVSLNVDADVVIMTTEVLRNILYGSTTLTDAGGCPLFLLGITCRGLMHAAAALVQKLHQSFAEASCCRLQPLLLLVGAAQQRLHQPPCCRVEGTASPAIASIPPTPAAGSRQATRDACVAGRP